MQEFFADLELLVTKAIYFLIAFLFFCIAYIFDKNRKG